MAIKFLTEEQFGNGECGLYLAPGLAGTDMVQVWEEKFVKDGYGGYWDFNFVNYFHSANDTQEEKEKYALDYYKDYLQSTKVDKDALAEISQAMGKELDIVIAEKVIDCDAFTGDELFRLGWNSCKDYMRRYFEELWKERMQVLEEKPQEQKPMPYLPYKDNGDGTYDVDRPSFENAINKMSDEAFIWNVWWDITECGDRVLPFDMQTALAISADDMKTWWETPEKLDGLKYTLAADLISHLAKEDTKYNDYDGITRDARNAILEAVANGTLHTTDTFVTIDSLGKPVGGTSAKALAKDVHPEAWDNMLTGDCWENAPTRHTIIHGKDIVINWEEYKVSPAEEKHPYHYDAECHLIDSEEIWYGNEMFDTQEDAEAFAMKTMKDHSDVTEADIVYVDDVTGDHTILKTITNEITVTFTRAELAEIIGRARIEMEELSKYMADDNVNKADAIRYEADWKSILKKCIAKIN